MSLLKAPGVQPSIGNPRFAPEFPAPAIPTQTTKAFAPLLVANKGRTTIIGSISGFVSGAQFGIYSMSKFAVEAYTDALAAETADTGVHVSVIEPGSFKSKIREKVVMHSGGKSQGEVGDLTEEEKAQFDQTVGCNESLTEPDAVADATIHALFADKPRRRYMVVPDEEEAALTIRTVLSQ